MSFAGGQCSVEFPVFLPRTQVGTNSLGVPREASTTVCVQPASKVGAGLGLGCWFSATMLVCPSVRLRVAGSPHLCRPLSRRAAGCPGPSTTTGLLGVLPQGSAVLSRFASHQGSATLYVLLVLLCCVIWASPFFLYLVYVAASLTLVVWLIVLVFVEWAVPAWHHCSPPNLLT